MNMARKCAYSFFGVLSITAVGCKQLVLTNYLKSLLNKLLVHMNLKKLNTCFLLVLSWILVISCSNMNFELPQGPKGDDGKSAYDLWKEEVAAGNINWPKDKTELADFLVYIKGEKGDKGEDGLSSYELWKKLIANGDATDPHNPGQTWPASKNSEADFWDFLTGRDGQSPHVGENGNWWIGNVDTGVKATGKDGLDGKDGMSAYELWKQMVEQGEVDWPNDQIAQNDFFTYLKGKDGANGITPHVGTNGNWYIGSTDTGVSAKGEKGDDGLTPYVGNNGNWWLGDTDTKVPARGKDGETPVIKDGNWWIGETNTGIAAKGEKGDKGEDGVTPVIKDGYWWIGETNTGVKAQGEKGDDGATGLSPYIGENGNWWLGDTDTMVPAKGESGKDGAAGASAYELWLKDVRAGEITGKDGNPWPADKITMSDFYTYLSGDDGEDGQSTYELWKTTAATGQLDNPHKPGEKWPANEISEIDFYRFLAGKDGDEGTNGLSAYQLWKEDLAKRCGTDNPILDNKTGAKWDCEKNTLDDFYEFLRGKDGQDGEDGADGKPGELGKPGAEVTVVYGVPNVIAEYSQPEYGEYVRTTDGGVRYTVYDEKGQAAPGAVVKGMPGIAPEKEYTADGEGKFIVPKEDLPEIQAVEARWGKTASVTIAGGTPKESAMNTYVPNRIHLRIKLGSYTPILNYYQRLYFDVERKINPDDKWQKLPAYLPNYNRSLEAYQVSDKEDPTSIMTDNKIYGNSNTSTNGGVLYYVAMDTNRPVMQNTGDYKNNWKDFWDGNDVYYTVRSTTPYYGELILWNGTAFLPPYQMGPTLKTIKMKTFIGGDEPSFSCAEGELDYSNVDMTKIYKADGFKIVKETDKPEYVETVVYEEDEIKQLKAAYVKFRYSSSQGTQEATSSNKSSSFNEPTYKVLGPFLNAVIKIETSYSNSHTFYNDLYIGTLKKKAGEQNAFYIERYKATTTFAIPDVTYEP